MVTTAQALPLTDLADRSGGRDLGLGEFHSILFPHALPAEIEDRPDPAFFHDLNLDQLLSSLVAGRDEYQLRPFFLAPLQDRAVIAYRQDVFRDLERPAVIDCIQSFAAAMRAARRCRQTASKMHYREQQQAWLIEEVEIYCNALASFASALTAAPISSRGLTALRSYLGRHVESKGFRALWTETRALNDRLQRIPYCLVIDGSAILVRRCRDEPDYAAEVTRTFRHFSAGARRSYEGRFGDLAEMNHIEAAILGRVKRLFPEPFAELESYFDRYHDYADWLIVEFDREVQFYLAYLEYIGPMRRAGLPFVQPRLATEPKLVHVENAFDVVLAAQLAARGGDVVGNDIELTGVERILIVSGPNQGGKTTFARMFGQLHYLARLGVPIPGSRAELFLCDQIFSHFEKQELGHDLRGKLEDDLLRIHEILERADAGSVVVLNEIFNSTTLQDAISLSTKVLNRIAQLDCLCVCVTFVAELASLGPQTVSMVSSMVPGDPDRRTFKLLRQPADGLAYAMTLAEKYRLTYQRLQERIPS